MVTIPVYYLLFGFNIVLLIIAVLGALLIAASALWLRDALRMDVSQPLPSGPPGR